MAGTYNLIPDMEVGATAVEKLRYASNLLYLASQEPGDNVTTREMLQIALQTTRDLVAADEVRGTLLSTARRIANEAGLALHIAENHSHGGGDSVVARVHEPIPVVEMSTEGLNDKKAVKADLRVTDTVLGLEIPFPITVAPNFEMLFTITLLNEEGYPVAGTPDITVYDDMIEVALTLDSEDGLYKYTFVGAENITYSTAYTITGMEKQMFGEITYLQGSGGPGGGPQAD